MSKTIQESMEELNQVSQQLAAAFAISLEDAALRFRKASRVLGYGRGYPALRDGHEIDVVTGERV